MEFTYLMMRIAQVVGLAVGLFFAILVFICVCADAYESCKQLWENEQ